MVKTKWLIGAVAAAALVLASCGSAGDNASSSGSESETSQASSESSSSSEAPDSSASETSESSDQQDGKSVDFPEHEITIIVPYSAGGSSDGAARAFADSLTKVFGSPVVVENREGGGAVIGVSVAAKAKPDGYTALLTTVSPMTIILFTNPDITYTADDFRGVAGLAEVPLMLVTAKDSPWKTWDDLKNSSNPPTTYSTTGIGNSIDISASSVFRAINAEGAAVPFNSATEALAAVLGGQVDLTVTEITTGMAAYEGGTVNVLAVSGDEPLPELPDVPTLKDVTGSDCSVSSSFALTVPAGTPDEVVDILKEGSKEAIASDTYQTYLTSLKVRPSANPDGDDWMTATSTHRDALEQCYNELIANK